MSSQGKVQRPSDSQGKACGSQRYLEVLTMIYAIAMVLGFSALVRDTYNSFFSAGFDWREWRDILSSPLWAGVAPMIIGATVLMRFFFAPPCNIGVLLRTFKRHEDSQTARKIVVVDAAVLLIHSLIFYFMCQSAFKKDDLGQCVKPAQFVPEFYIFLMVLLACNSVWLFSIACRTLADSQKKPFVLPFWAWNNIIGLVLLVLVIGFEFSSHAPYAYIGIGLVYLILGMLLVWWSSKKNHRWWKPRLKGDVKTTIGWISFLCFGALVYSTLLWGWVSQSHLQGFYSLMCLIALENSIIDLVTTWEKYVQPSSC